MLHPYFKDAANYLLASNFKNVDDGKYELIGEDLFSIVSTLEDSEENETNLEVHKKYIDIHFIYKGTEKFGIKHAAKCLSPIGVFDEGKDVLFYNDKDYSILNLSENDCVIVYPEDAHAPVLQTVGLKKVIVKIVVNVASKS